MNPVEKCGDGDEDSPNKQLFAFIAHQTDAYFKSQQSDEPELEQTEKESIVENLFMSNPSLFIYRYGKYLDDKRLDYLESAFLTNEDITIQIKDLRGRNKQKQCAIKNRRYQAMQMLLDEGLYFSNSEMQTRNPYLFDKLIGQFMDDKERKELLESNYKINYDNKTTFSTFLMEQIRSVHMKCKYMVDEHAEKQEENEDDEDENDDSSDEDEEAKTSISDTDKKLMEKEFRTQMMEQFLIGKDTDFFDYSQVDNNEKFDVCDQFEKDQQDKYFDED